MIINNKKELNLFEKAVEKCHRAVLVTTPEGRQYDLKRPGDYIKGITELMEKREDKQEPEVFTNCLEDELILFNYIKRCRRLAAS